MLKFNANELFNLSVEEIWALEESQITVVCVDGEVLTHTRAVILSWYTTVYNRVYGSPIKCSYILGANRIIKKGTVLRLMEGNLFDTYEYLNRTVHIEDLCLLTYRTINQIYNGFTDLLSSYVSSISIFDFIQVVEQPEIKQANENLLPTQASINNAYDVIDSVLRDPNSPTLKNNEIYKNYISSMVNPGQVRQCVGPRGYLTDIDSSIFKYPVLVSYTKGISILADSMKESRSAAKSVIFNRIKISVTEYFNRELQLFNSIITGIAEGDCGTSGYLEFKVKPEDLNTINGKYHILNDGTLELVTPDSKHLIDQTIKIRSTMHCRETDQYKVCSTCFGTLSLSIPDNTNLGYVSSGILGEKGSQNVMGTKHLDGSSKTDDFEISVLDKRFIKLENKRIDDVIVNVIRLLEESPGTRLIISARDAGRLSEVEYKEVENLNASTVTEIRNIQLLKQTPEGFVETINISVSGGVRVGWLSPDFLKFIKTVGYSITESGNYEIPLKGWAKTKPFIILPMKQTDTAKYVRDIKSYVMTCGKKTARSKGPSNDELLLGLYKLITSKLPVNLAHIEIIMLAELVTSLDPHNHNIPTDREQGVVGTYRESMKYRSMGTAMGYQGQYKILTRPESFNVRDRPDSIFDPFILPE